MGSSGCSRFLWSYPSIETRAGSGEGSPRRNYHFDFRRRLTDQSSRTNSFGFVIVSLPRLHKVVNTASAPNETRVDLLIFLFARIATINVITLDRISGRFACRNTRVPRKRHSMRFEGRKCRSCRRCSSLGGRVGLQIATTILAVLVIVAADLRTNPGNQNSDAQNSLNPVEHLDITLPTQLSRLPTVRAFMRMFLQIKAIFQ